MPAGLNALSLDGRGSTIRWHEIDGAGPPLICLPGISFAAVPSFLSVITAPALAGRRAIMLDYLGSGASDPAADGRYDLAAHVEAIHAVIAALDVGPVPVIGHSMGGTLGIALARDFPDAVSVLYVGEGNVTGGGGGHSRRIAGQSLGQFITSGFDAFVDDIEADARAGSQAQAAIAHSWRRAEAVGLHGNARMLVGLDDSFFDDFLSLPHSRVFIYGAQSHPSVTGKTMPDAPDPGRLSDAGVAVETLKSAGHLLGMENPTGFAEIVAKHLPDPELTARDTSAMALDNRAISGTP